tara:strand:+ start:168 stop:560 length:393 start_codon:yes stop_codon:yes gene_type:complete
LHESSVFLSFLFPLDVRGEIPERLICCLQVEVYQTLYRWARDVSGKAILVEGNKDNFCTGSDIKSLYKSVSGEGVDGATPGDYFRHQYKLFYLLSRAKKPLIPYVYGRCTGAGMGLVANSPVAVGTDKGE